MHLKYPKLSKSDLKRIKNKVIWRPVYALAEQLKPLNLEID